MREYSKIKKQDNNKNVVIGFGITEKTINSLKKADGLVVGSAICKGITSSIKKRQNTVTNVTNIVRRLKIKLNELDNKKLLKQVKKLNLLFTKEPQKKISQTVIGLHVAVDLF